MKVGYLVVLWVVCLAMVGGSSFSQVSRPEKGEQREGEVMEREWGGEVEKEVEKCMGKRSEEEKEECLKELTGRMSCPACPVYPCVSGENWVCYSCAHDHYYTGPGGNPCAPCPEGTISPGGSNSISDCVPRPRPGFWFDGSSLRPCDGSSCPSITVPWGPRALDLFNFDPAACGGTDPGCLSCHDGVKNGQESDVDCGGPFCGPCGNLQDCAFPEDCASGVCGYYSCRPCDDGVQNDLETGVDCGGPYCYSCGVGEGCNTGSDCNTGNCAGGYCAGEPYR